MKKRGQLSVLITLSLFIVNFQCLGNTANAEDAFYVIPISAATFKGTWSPTSTYLPRDFVYYNGSSWFSLKSDNKGNQPDLYPAAWTLLAKRGDNGSNGATGPQGPSGPTGPAGPAVHTSAVCASGSSNNSNDCSCSGGRTISHVYVTGYTPCTISSDTGSCTAYGHTKTGTGDQTTSGACCLCAP